MSMKAVAQRVLPAGVFERTKRIVKSVRTYNMAFSQARRFNKAYAQYDSHEIQQTAAWLTFYAHQIEKGLSHTNFRYGFGHEPLRCLKRSMDQYRAVNPSYATSDVYKSALSALHEYATRHEGHEEKLSYARSLFSEKEWDEILQASTEFGGSEIIKGRTKEHNMEIPFSELTKNRHSIREYSDLPITYEELQPALELAMRVPSVCNRQPSRVKVILNKELIEKALRVQGGFNGYDVPPALLLITADNRVFLSPQERNEGFTDGGLFAMSLLLSLEAVGIAACPLNTMFGPKADKITRKLLEIPDYENLVMYIAVGHFPEEVRTCCSKRLSAEEITTVL